MSDSEDDDVGFDLAAWEAPPPAGDLADAVIARVRAPAAAAAVETPARKTKWWIAGALAAVAVGAVSVALAVRDDGERNSSGAVATAKPSHLELGGTAVDLEADTDVWWVRGGTRIVAMQPRGAATWRVAPGDELVIDAGATVASVSASGASLRVEVEMNLSDARLIGTSAVTAAAVALVTVIVYEGHIKVTGNDKTVEVAAGSTVQIAPGKAPVEPDRVADLEKRLRTELQYLKLENDLLKKQVAGAIPRPGDLKTFMGVMATLEPAMRRCAAGTQIDEHFDLGIEIESGNPAVDWKGAAPSRFSACVDQVIAKAPFPDTLAGSFDYTLAIENVAVQTPAPPVKPPTTVDSTPEPACSDRRALDALEAKADTAYSSGSFAASLVMFEKLLKCKRTAVTKAYLAACRSRNFARAKVHYQTIGNERFAQICLREGFDPRVP